MSISHFTIRQITKTVKIMQKYFILILTIFFISCVNQQNKNSHFTKEQITSLHLDSTKILNIETDSVIKVDMNQFLKKQTFDFGSLVKEVKLIPLETTDESLLDNILKILVTDSNIYIYDDFKGGGIVIFNNKGKFIKRIPYGQGPGELYKLNDIDFDKDKNELVAYQHPFLLFYTASGEFVRHQRLPFGFFNFTIIPDGYVFKTIDRDGNEHLGHLEDFTLLVTDKNFKVESVGLPTFPRDIHFGGYNYLYKNNTIKVTQNLTDTIFQYISGTDQLKVKYVLDYSKKKIPEQYLLVSHSEFKNITKHNDYYFYIGQYLETESQNVFFLENAYIGTQTIVYRDKKSGSLRGGTNADFNQNEIPPIAFPKAAYGNYFISSYLPSKKDSFLSKSSIISSEDKLKVKGLIEDDNPVLVFYKLKNF